MHPKSSALPTIPDTPEKRIFFKIFGFINLSGAFLLSVWIGCKAKIIPHKIANLFLKPTIVEEILVKSIVETPCRITLTTWKENAFSIPKTIRLILLIMNKINSFFYLDLLLLSQEYQNLPER